MRFHIITIFPAMFDSYLNDSMLKRAIDNKLIEVKFYNPRDYSKNKHHKVDDTPYGGGPGMVMMVDPIVQAIKKARGRSTKRTFKIIFLAPAGTEFTTDYAKRLNKKYTDTIIICGRYEGIDSRVKKIFKTEDVTIGNYVLTGGELASMVIIDVVSRQVAGVLGNEQSLEETRVASPEMYTRPADYLYAKKHYKVPEVLMSGDHAKIEAWRVVQQNIKNSKN